MGSDQPARRDRSDSSIWLICVLTAALIITGICWRIHVSQIRQSKITTDRNYHELNSSLQSKLSALNSNQSDLKRMHSDLRHQLTEVETKYRSVNETKAQICELLTSRREQAFSQNWIRNEGPCYYISTVYTSYDEAKQYCSKSDSKLLEINSAEEENFVTKTVRDQGNSYWIGKCKDWEVASNVMFRMYGGFPECGVCRSYTERKPCDQFVEIFLRARQAELNSILQVRPDRRHLQLQRHLRLPYSVS
ncbi:oxidized low-density lipoprotein receptor 1-like [Hemitrygon akajei]|uniref:oxidized low-density lipoprotein receptor 1-like n=1 Tax=Hemitrygon akajei TaxID=2704970 RepID=UPI003BF9AEBB